MRPLISDATMFAAQRGRNRDRSAPIQPTRDAGRLPPLDEFDPREEPARFAIWIAVGAVLLIGLSLIASIH